jgi:methionyl-tRNA formyltransferase
MRIVFMGTPVFAATALGALIQAGHDISCVYAQPPRPAGRGKNMQKSSVQLLAEQHGINVRTPVSLKSPETQAEFSALNADIAVVAAYGLLLPQAILDAPRYGCLNIHASLLPRWRGAAPIHRAVEAGDTQTGICIMQMDAGLDTGPVLLRATTPIAPHDTTGSLHDQLAELGGALCVRALADFAALTPIPQPDDGVTYARKIDKAEARLDFSQTADVLERRIRALNPSPGAFLELAGERLKILGAEIVPHPHRALACGEIMDAAFSICCGNATALRPVLVQRAGKQPMTVQDFLRGYSLDVGSVLS